MYKTLGISLTCVVSLFAALPAPVAAQRPPRLSGSWVLVSATTSHVSGAGRGDSAQSGDEVPTRSIIWSGAAFNCGQECILVQEGQILRIENAALRSKTQQTPLVTMQLDGHQHSVLDSFSGNRQLSVTAKWSGNRLEMLTSSNSHSITQTLSIQKGQLVVVSASDVPSDAPVTLTYEKKK